MASLPLFFIIYIPYIDALTLPRSTGHPVIQTPSSSNNYVAISFDADDELSWTDAQEWCQLVHNTSLATIQTSAEWDEIYALLDIMDSVGAAQEDGTTAWVGFRSNANGNFVWAPCHDSIYDVCLWDECEANCDIYANDWTNKGWGVFKSNECGQIERSTTTKAWNTDLCTDTNDFICNSASGKYATDISCTNTAIYDNENTDSLFHCGSPRATDGPLTVINSSSLNYIALSWSDGADELSWYEAQNYCQFKFATSLATIQNDIEWLEFYALAGYMYDTLEDRGPDVWFGMSSNSNGNLVWAPCHETNDDCLYNECEANTEWNADSWTNTDRSNSFSDSQCGIVDRSGTPMTWADASCTAENDFICNSPYGKYTNDISCSDITPSPTTNQPTTSLPTTSEPTTSEPTTDVPTTSDPTTSEPTTSEPTTSDPTTANPTTNAPTTFEPTTNSPTTAVPTTASPTSSPTTNEPTTNSPTTSSPTDPTATPTTATPTTSNPTSTNTSAPTTGVPTTSYPTTSNPTTSNPTTSQPTTSNPTTSEPTTANPTTSAPTTSEPTTDSPTTAVPTTASPTTNTPTTSIPTTNEPTTNSPTTSNPTATPTTGVPTTSYPTTSNPSTSDPTTSEPTTSDPTTSNPTTAEPTTSEPTTISPTTTVPTTTFPTTFGPTTSIPTTNNPTTFNPTTVKPTTSSPTTFNPTTSNPTTSTSSPTSPTTKGPTLSVLPPGATKDIDGQQQESTLSTIANTSGEFENNAGDDNMMLYILIGAIFALGICIGLCVGCIMRRKSKSDKDKNMMNLKLNAMSSVSVSANEGDIDIQITAIGNGTANTGNTTSGTKKGERLLLDNDDNDGTDGMDTNVVPDDQKIMEDEGDDDTDLSAEKLYDDNVGPGYQQNQGMKQMVMVTPGDYNHETNENDDEDEDEEEDDDDDSDNEQLYIKTNTETRGQ